MCVCARARVCILYLVLVTIQRVFPFRQWSIHLWKAELTREPGSKVLGDSLRNVSPNLNLGLDYKYWYTKSQSISKQDSSCSPRKRNYILGEIIFLESQAQRWTVGQRRPHLQQE